MRARGFTRQGWAIVLAGSSLGVLILVSAALITGLNRQSEIRQWQDLASNISLAAAAQTHQAIKASEMVLRTITDRVEEAGIDSEADFRRVMSGQDIYDMLRERAAGLPQIDVATIVDDDGQILNFTRWWPPLSKPPPGEPINIADRDTFKAQMADPKLDLYLSAPVQSRVTGTWTFFLSRKIHGKSGQVLGLILTGLRVEFFTDFFKALNGKGDRAFQLLRDDGILVARFPTLDDFLGRSFRYAAALGLGLLDHAEDGTAVTRLPRLTDPNDKRLRIVSPRRVPDYPLVVNVLIFDDEFLDQWRSVAWQIGTMAITLAALILALTLTLARLLSNQEATMRELDQSRLAAEAAMHAKSEFLAMMSHEIRTPINAVIGMSDMLLESALPERERRFARIVSESASHLLNLIVTAQVASDTSRQPEFRDQRLRVGAQGGQQVPTLFLRG